MQETHSPVEMKPSWLDKPLINAVNINWETVLFAVVIVVAVITRFYDLDSRVMSHDESLHTYYSWRLFKGFGFQHSPLMHGPLQFHFIALFYYLFGDSDLSARLFAVLTNLGMIGMMWHYRRYLGRAGALIAAALLTISPYMLYYGRYVRNEAYVGLFGVVTFWAVLRYLDTGKNNYLYYLTGATVLHFASKETSFIYTAQILIFLGLLFVRNVTTKVWPRPEQRKVFLILLMLAFIGFGIAGGFYFGNGGVEPLSATDVASPSNPDEVLGAVHLGSNNLPIYFGGFGLTALGGAVFFLLAGYGLNNLRKERTFDLVILLFSLVLPQLAPFIIRQLGWNPLDYSTEGMIRTAAVLVPMFLLSVGLGALWNIRSWLVNAAIFYAIFMVFYTTIFTNGQGFFTGLVGSLGYWLEQQAVKRGNQPWYYYLLIQIPIYEFLPALGSMLALSIGLKRWLWQPVKESVLVEDEFSDTQETIEGEPAVSASQMSVELSDVDEYLDQAFEADPESSPAKTENLMVPLLGYWTITSFAAYTIAGEKMPWLTFHIALPMILLSGWALGQVIKNVDWEQFREKHGPAVIALLLVFVPALASALISLLGPNPPFEGQELAQLQTTSTFSLSILTMLLGGFGIWKLTRSWGSGQLGRIILLSFFGLLALITTRSAFNASFVNYDLATEYLVYAHSAGPVKEVLEQAEEISRRTAGDLSIAIAYDNDVSWPFTWYMRNFPNNRYYGETPTRDLRDVPIIIVGDNNFDKLMPIVGQAYYEFNYIRMWWPDQDYFNLTWDRIENAFTDPQMRQAIFNIWFNRDYSLYSDLTGKDMSVGNWNPSDRMRMYIRKDIAASIWEFGVGPSVEELVADPYENKGVELLPDFSFGTSGADPGQFNAPRGLAVSENGEIYVADSRNHRIQHFNATGELINTWGSFADAAASAAPGGTFNEPWDVAVAPDGSIFVADTWNHRIQKFAPDGTFITMWGYFGTAETPDAFWGPRSLAINPDGRLYVTDTGNKRIAIFDLNGNFISQFGSVGFSAGQFDEPVGLAMDDESRLFVADTWNQRIQVFSSNGEPLNNWEVFAWFGDSLENKPYIEVDSTANRLYIADPEGYRVLEYTLDGDFIRYWGDYSTDIDGFGLVSGLAVDAQGSLWISDGMNNRVIRYRPLATQP